MAYTMLLSVLCIRRQVIYKRLTFYTRLVFFICFLHKSMYYVNPYDDDEVSIFDLTQIEEPTQEDCESCKL